MTGIEPLAEPSAQPTRECFCLCHYPTEKVPALMHFVPCCQGQCSGYGKWFVSGLLVHVAACGGEPKWSSADTMAQARRQ